MILEKDTRGRNKDPAMRQYAIRWSWIIGHCLQCHSEFKKRTVWQKYCCEDCRKLNWENRYQRKLKLKKNAIFDG